MQICCSLTFMAVQTDNNRPPGYFCALLKCVFSKYIFTTNIAEIKSTNSLLGFLRTMFVVDVVLMIFQIMGSVQCSAIINSYATCKGFLSKLYKIRLYWFRNVTPLSAALISSGVLWFSSLTVSKIKLKTECYPSLQHTALTATTAFSSVTISKTNLI